jgi:hypothetical protein
MPLPPIPLNFRIYEEIFFSFYQRNVFAFSKKDERRRGRGGGGTASTTYDNKKAMIFFPVFFPVL